MYNLNSNEMKNVNLKFKPARPMAKSSVIIVRSYINGDTLSLSTGISVNPKYWDKRNMKVKNSVANSFLMNGGLNKFRIDLEKIIEDLTMKNQLTVASIKKELRGESSILNGYNPQSYKELLEEDYFKSKLNLSKDTKSSYLQTYDVLTRFNESNGVKNATEVSLKSINNENFYMDFVKYMRGVEHFAKNTQDKHIKQIITLMNYAEKKGLLVGTAFKSFQRMKVLQPKSVYLNERELKHLKEFDFEDRELSSVRDWFIIESYTGLRIGDIFNLTIDGFDFENEVITTTVKKNEHGVISLPLHPWVGEIIRKNNYALPTKIKEYCYNDNLKVICEKAGFMTPVYSTINGKEGYYPKCQLVSSHTARRNLITNLYHDGFDLVEIKEISGHSSEQMVRRYLQVENEKIVRKVTEHWKQRLNS